ncbi:DUF222 domain-containing protein, partial [Frankia canadensis]|uniref:DUF222 domain-containing protein n=1 Tax=Frankia canadensis TaxID=1836972 RepID=UPI0014028E20
MAPDPTPPPDTAQPDTAAPPSGAIPAEQDAEDLAELADLALNADNVPTEVLGDAIRRWSGRLTAGTCLWLCLIAVFDQKKIWQTDGQPSCVDWLAARCDLTSPTARSYHRVATALRTLPLIRHAFARGQLTYTKVRALSRIATPTTEHTWLDHAHSNTADQLEHLITSHRQKTTNPTTTHTKRSLRWRPRTNGMITLTVVLTADEATHLATALHATRASLDDTTPPTTDTDTDTASVTNSGSGSPPPTNTHETNTDDTDPDGDGEPPTNDVDALLALATAFFHHHTHSHHSSEHSTSQNENHPHDTTNTDDGDHGDPGGEDRQQPPGQIQGTLSGILGPHIGLPATVLERLGCDTYLRDLHTDQHG